MDRIPDEAWVVRGGRNQPEDIARGTAKHPSGIVGISVVCSEARTIEELAATVPHGQIGITTVKAIRAIGGDVFRTNGRNPFHATLTGVDATVVSRLLPPTIANPATNRKIQ